MKTTFTAAALLLAVTQVLAATPSHLYELNGSLNDSLGGPALTSAGGTLGASSYSFAANQGLSLDNVLGSVYTIDTVVALDAVDGYRKLVDFNALTADAGFYVLNAQLNFYPTSTGAATTAAGDWAHITLTRDAAGTVAGYLNGVQQWSFSDTGNLATFSSANATATFFIDDLATGQREASGGKVDYIAIYDKALSAAEIGQISAVPEPESYALMLAGLAGLGLWARKQRQ